MAKKSRPDGQGDEAPKADIRKEAAGGSGPPGEGSSNVWRNERGELCVGNECFAVVLDPERSEIRVILDEGSCEDPKLQEFIENCKAIVGQPGGSRTVYEVRNELRSS